ncbi:LOW QUALITY PROTEIN: retinol dehydrogenase 16-like [Rhynochetos jubatus]
MVLSTECPCVMGEGALLSFSDSLHVAILASILGLIIYWLIRDSHRVRNLSGKHVFIIGRDTGLGNSLVKCPDKRGFCLIATWATEKGGQELPSHSSLSLNTANLNSAGSNTTATVVFVTEETAGKGNFGMVSNAEGTPPAAPTDLLRIKNFHLVLDACLLGSIEIMLKLLPLLKTEGIVNLINGKGLMAFGGGYSLSKWGMEVFSDILQSQMQHFGVKGCIVEHGFFKAGVGNSDVIEKDLLRLQNRLNPKSRDSYGEKYFVEYK